MEILSNEKTSQNLGYKFICNFCNFKCFKKGDWNRHILRPKHIKNINGNQKNIENIQKNIIYKCIHCNYEYKSNSGLWRHKKICKIEKEDNNNISFLSNFSKQELEYDLEKVKNMNKDELVLMLIKQNNKLLDIIKHRTM